jgi:hypothetical protein
MAFAKGKAFVILNRMAEQGNPEAKKILKNLNSMSQEQLDGELSKLFGKSGGGEKAAAPKGKADPRDKNIKAEAKTEVGDEMTDLMDRGLTEKEAAKATKESYKKSGDTVKGEASKQMKSAKEGIKPVDYREKPFDNELAGPDVTKQLAPLRDKFKNEKGMSMLIDNIEAAHAETLGKNPNATLEDTIVQLGKDAYAKKDADLLAGILKVGTDLPKKASKEEQASMKDTEQKLNKLKQDIEAETKGGFTETPQAQAYVGEIKERLAEDGLEVDEGYILDIMEGYDESKQSVDEYLSTYKPRGNKEKEAYDTIMAGITGQARFEKQNPIKEPKGQMKSAKQGIKPVKAPKQKAAVEIVDIYDVEPGLRTVAKENPELDDAIEKINEYYYEQYNRGDLDEDSTPQQIMRALNKVGRELYEFEEDENIKLAMKKIKEKFGGSKK